MTIQKYFCCFNNKITPEEEEYIKKERLKLILPYYRPAIHNNRFKF
jgi:hypothetical protein